MALGGIDLTVPSGEKLAVFGSNGAGKSTLLRVVAGLLRPGSGRVAIQGQDPRALKSWIGYLGHDPFLYDYLTVGENLELYCDLYGAARTAAPRCADLVGMSNRWDTRVNELSQGERQRAGLARALLHDPKYLLLDEPFSNLDAEGVVRVQSIIGTKDRTVLLVTHDQERAAAVCDRSVRLEKGRLTEPSRDPRALEPLGSFSLQPGSQ